MIAAPLAPVPSRNSSVCRDVTGRLFGDESGVVRLGRSGCSIGDDVVIVDV
jgi:hypothetical protein